MSTRDFVVQEEPTGRWVWGCLADVHPTCDWGDEEDGYPTEAAADTALRRHRRQDAALRKAIASHLDVLKPCPTCGRTT